MQADNFLQAICRRRLPEQVRLHKLQLPVFRFGYGKPEYLAGIRCNPESFGTEEDRKRPCGVGDRRCMFSLLPV